MWDILKFIGFTIILAVVMFGGYSLLSRYVFNRVRINKWIILGASIISFIIIFLNVKFPYNYSETVNFILTAIFGILLLWFFDVNKNGYPKVKKDKKVVIKPKAKPNRVKKKS